MALLAGVELAGPAQAQVALRSPRELKGLSLEELLDTQVISMSRTLEDWRTAPTAIGVLTDEEIHRTGAIRLAEALRAAPGLHVARYVGSSYAVTSRGFASSSINKMQVLLDGRSLYTPLFSGVFWEIQDTLLEDLDRIEVVRGPGATLWGANAMNGVINIVSKSARDTQGTLLLGGGGDEERAVAGARYGGKLGGTTYYRTWFKSLERDDQVLNSGASAQDGMRQIQGGFRLDSFQGGGDTFTLQGDLYSNFFGIASRPDAENRGGNILGRWTRDYSPDTALQVQLYYDVGLRDVPQQFREDRRTIDLDAQYRFVFAGSHRVVAGGNYRQSYDKTGTGGTFIFLPAERTIELVSAFVQDEIALVPDKLTAYVGSKFEYNDFTGFEFQPSARVSFMPTERQTAWVAVSRAVRTPTRVDADSRFLPNPANGFVFIRGSSDFRSENVLAWEAGYRVQPFRPVFLDLAVFHNEYTHLRTLEPSPVTGFPLVIRNEREGHTDGAELAATVEIASWWRLSGSYSHMHQSLRFNRGSADPTAGSLEGNDPDHFATLRSAMNLAGGWELDLSARRVGSLPNPATPAYTEIDARLAWHARVGPEFAVVGRNLLKKSHAEFGGVGTEVQRNVYGTVTWHF